MYLVNGFEKIVSIIFSYIGRFLIINFAVKFSCKHSNIIKIILFRITIFLRYLWSVYIIWLLQFIWSRQCVTLLFSRNLFKGYRKIYHKLHHYIKVDSALYHIKIILKVSIVWNHRWKCWILIWFYDLLLLPLLWTPWFVLFKKTHPSQWCTCRMLKSGVQKSSISGNYMNSGIYI